MHKLHGYIKQTLFKIIDFFYPPFKKLMPLQTFRYAACGGGNMILDLSFFTFFYNFIVNKQIVELGFVAISPHIFSFILTFFITFPIGFYLSRYVVWQQTEASKRIQLFRYFVVVMGCVLLKYLLLKLFIEQFMWWPSIANLITIPLVTLFSYFTQRNYSFKSKSNEG